MACITQKNSRRYRIQFTMRRELFEIYQENLELSRETRCCHQFWTRLRRVVWQSIGRDQKEFEEPSKTTGHPQNNRQVTEALSAPTVLQQRENTSQIVSNDDLV